MEAGETDMFMANSQFPLNSMLGSSRCQGAVGEGRDGLLGWESFPEAQRHGSEGGGKDPGRCTGEETTHWVGQVPGAWSHGRLCTVGWWTHWPNFRQQFGMHNL